MSEISLSRPRALKGSGALGPVRDAFAGLSGLQAAFVAAVLGAVGNLAFAPFHFIPALGLALTGLIWLMDGARRHKRWGRAFLARGLAFGFGHFVAGLHWIANAFAVVPGTMGFVWMAVILLPAILAGVWAVFLLMAGAFWSSSPSRVYVFVLFMGLAEWVRGHLFGGFPWNLAATAWVPGGPVSQAAAMGGVYWLTLVTLFLLAAPAALSDDRERSGLAGRAMPLILAVAALAGGWAWGAQRLQAPVQMSERHALLVDIGVPFRDKFQISVDAQLRRYLEFLAMPGREPGDIVIWPEAPLPPVRLTGPDGQGRPAGLIEWPDALDAIAAYLDGRFLIVGSQHYVGGWEPPTYNALAVIDADSARLGPRVIYYKFRLVPLGELAAASFVPFGAQLAGLLPSSLQAMAQEGFTPGPGPEYIAVEGLPAFVPLVCYEVLFPEIARSQAGEAQWLVNISLDGWFGTGVGPLQHYAQARFRAIELGLPLARSASRGVTAMVDPYGRETARGAVQAGDPEGWRSSVVRAAIPAPLAGTPYRRFGDVFFWIGLVVAGGIALASWRR